VTTPAPPPTSQVIPTHDGDEEATQATHPAIPPPPRVPRIVGG
jgi:hypothetical protein